MQRLDTYDRAVIAALLAALALLLAFGIASAYVVLFALRVG